MIGRARKGYKIGKAGGGCTVLSSVDSAKYYTCRYLRDQSKTA